MLKRYYARELPASRTARGAIARQLIADMASDNS
jgi:hypothetical protein